MMNRILGLGVALLLGSGVSAESQEETKHLMRVVKDDATIRIFRGDKVILQYNKVPTAESEDHEPHFVRTGYIHPVYAPSGNQVTGDFAADHKHQHGLFFAWTRTGFEGRKPEFWNQKLEAGRVSFVRSHYKDDVAGSDDLCSFTVEHLWEDLTAKGGPREVLKETWKVTAHDAGDEKFVFDIESVQWLIGQEPLTIEKYHYGGMAIRGPDQWFIDDKEAAPPSNMLTSEGLTRIEGNHSRPNWVAMSGPVDGGTAGVAVLADKRNFRFPQWVRLHPTKPYFVYTPMVEEPFEIESGSAYVSRFRYVVFDGEPDVKMIEREWKSMGED